MSGFTKRVLASILSILILSGIFPGYSGLYCQASVTQNSYQVGDIIEFGSYPQTRVTNTDLIETLNSLDKEWLGCPYQRRYHRAFMYYADVEYNTEKYRAILIETFRESSADKYPGAKSSVYYQMRNSYSTSVVYWFRYEPLQWKILDPESGLAICQTIIDSQPFSYEDTDNYLDSSVRSWLNDSFCETAFADSQKQALQYMNIPDETSAVKERVTLLDKSQLSVSDYKLNTDASRMAVGTDYAKCQGLDVNTNGYSHWLLEDSQDYIIRPTGEIISGYTDNIYLTYLGIRPVISIDFNNPVIQTNQKINISDERIYLTPGEKKQLTIDMVSSDISEKETWTSNDASIATVSDSGMVTAMNIGETDVTVSINNTVVRCTVTVTAEEFVPEGWVGIYTIEDLNNIRNKPNNNYRLMADLDLSEATAEGGAYDVNGCGWKAIPYIKGNFDGNGHIIKGLRISGDAKSGLFETVYGNITNLKMYNIHVSIDDASFAGIIANQIIEGTVSNVVVSDFELTVETAYAKAGSSTFENSAQTFTGIGGIIGAAAKSRIENCSVSGNININGASAKTTVSCGGIVGYACNTINIFCYTDGDITVKLSTSKTDINGADVGGIAGCSLYSSDYTIPVYCYNDINITCTAYSVREGGILGKCPGITGPQYCVNAGTIFGRFEFNGMAGGIAGWGSGAQNSLNIGHVSMNASITATPKISGIAPYDKEYIFSSVDLTPFDGASGVSKYSESTYYICENEENTDDNALTPEEMKYEENFPKLDFNNIWFIDLSTGVEHPQLMRLPVKNEIPALIIDIHESAKSIDVGTEFNLDPTVSPSNAEEQLFYSSSDTSVATVSDDGVVKALSPGWALITVTTASGTKTQCKLTVNDHKFDQQTIITPATCSDTGYAEQICKTCGLILHQELPIDPDAHDWGEWFVVTAPTCSAVGVEKRICKHNPAHVETRDIEIDPDAHKAETFYTVDVKADCENNGSKSHHCEYCDAILDSVVIPARDHDLTSVTTESNCSEAGEIVYTCSHTDSTDEYEACSYTYTDPIEIDPEGHDWGEWFVVIAPTCSAVGVEKRVCKHNPAHVETRDIEIDPDAHKAETFYTVDVKADCVNNGSKSHHCEYCDAILDSVVIPAREHDLTSVTTSSTCSEAGEIVYTCAHAEATDEYKACHYTYTDPIAIDPDAHNWGEWFVVTAPTCSAVGVEKRICKHNPAHVETRNIAIDHDAHKAETFYTIDVKADCENDGSKSHHCEYCDAILDSMVIPARGHDLTSVTTSSTCSEAGEIVYTCSHTDSTDEYEACSYTYTEPIAIDSDAHDWGEWFVETAPTCSAVGVEKRICKHNPAHVETRDIEIDPDAHKAETFYTVDVKADCENNGSKSHHCEYCDAILDSVVIPARGHVYDDGVVTKNATCTENGVKTYTCTHTATDGYNACTHSYTEEIPALGHEFGDWYTVTEATATQEGLERRDCIRGDAYEERTIPKKRPVNDNEAIETEKTAEFDETTGNATIHLKAWSAANKIVSISKMGVPLDIVLIVDQSGSMEGRKLSALKNAASDFADVVYENAAANNVDHRIAIVGFAMGSYTQDEKAYPPYLNSEILTTGGAPIRYSTNLTKENYRDALVSVNDSDALNPVITKAIGNIEAKGATAADVGLTMANNIFAANPIDGTGRLRVVVFLTDGEPTNYSGYQKDVANAAIRQSSMLKNTYGALVYSVGVESNTDMTDRFLNYVSSNYPNAVNMDNGGAKDKNGGYYISVNDTAELSNIFREIATESISYTSDFTDLTLIDTVSDAFTLTTQQEFELRKNAIESLGIHNDDITVTRNENGMTTIQIDHVVPRQVTENLTVKYVAEFSFTVTADEDALKKGVYITNTDDAGVSMDGGATFEKTFEVPEITVSSDRGVAIFTINGEPFHITTVKIGDEVKAPAYTVDSGYTFSGWNIEDGYTLSGGSVTFDAVQTGEHEHHYAKIVVAQATCARHGETEYICECGDSYTETVPATGAHQWVAIRGAAAAEKLSNEEFRCEVCGDMMEKSLTYIITGTKTGRKGQTTAVEEELNLTNASGELSQPGTTVTITASVYGYFGTQKVSGVRVYRVEDDGSRTLLPSTYANNMVTFETDHFCTYIFEAVYECEEIGDHTDADADGYCDDCDTEIPQLSEWEKFRCKMCPTYERLKDTPVVGIIVTIVHFFVHLAHYISYLT